MIKDRRLGKILVSDALINDNPAVVRLLLSRVIVLEASHNTVYGKIEYLVIADEFDMLDEGDQIPMYQCTLNRKESDQISEYSITFNKV